MSDKSLTIEEIERVEAVWNERNVQNWDALCSIDNCVPRVLEMARAWHDKQNAIDGISRNLNEYITKTRNLAAENARLKAELTIEHNIVERIQRDNGWRNSNIPVATIIATYRTQAECEIEELEKGGKDE